MAGHAQVASVMRSALMIAGALIMAACVAPSPPRPGTDPAPPPPGETSGRPADPGSPSERTDERTEAEPADPVEPEDPAPDEDRQERSSGADPEQPAETAAQSAPDERTETAPEQPEAPAAPEPAPATDSKPTAEESTGTDPQAAPETDSLTISGRIRLSGGDAETSEAVVYFVPAASGANRRQRQAADSREIVTRDKTLSPAVLAVTPGTQVRFPNEDPILHNLFSVSPENGFDLGVYGPGESPSVEFERPGVVNIYCNVHHDMHAHVLVVDTPWHTSPDQGGRFELAGLPPGRGELHVWHRQSERWSRPIELPLGAPVEVTLPVTKPKLPPHRDKSGLPYNRRDRDPYR